MKSELRESYNKLSTKADQCRSAGDRDGELKVNLLLMELDLGSQPHLWPLPEHSEDMAWN